MTHSATPCRRQNPNSFALGRIEALHSTHCDSGTRCSEHQSSSDPAAAPVNCERCGSFQSVRWPTRKTRPNSTNTAAFGALPRIARRMRLCRPPDPDCGTATGLAWTEIGLDMAFSPRKALDSFPRGARHQSEAVSTRGCGSRGESDAVENRDDDTRRGTETRRRLRGCRPHTVLQR